GLSFRLGCGVALCRQPNMFNYTCLGWVSQPGVGGCKKAGKGFSPCPLKRARYTVASSCVAVLCPVMVRYAARIEQPWDSRVRVFLLTRLTRHQLPLLPVWT